MPMVSQVLPRASASSNGGGGNSGADTRTGYGSLESNTGGSGGSSTGTATYAQYTGSNAAHLEQNAAGAGAVVWLLAAWLTAL
jgi:hypothetical protein